MTMTEVVRYRTNAFKLVICPLLPVRKSKWQNVDDDIIGVNDDAQFWFD